MQARNADSLRNDNKSLYCGESEVRRTIGRAFSPWFYAATSPGALPQAGIERAFGPLAWETN